MKETYQKLFDDYTAKIDEFLALVRKAVHGENDARGKINAMIAEENGDSIQGHLYSINNIFETILEEICETKEKTNLTELRERYVSQMKSDFEDYPNLLDNEKKWREENKESQDVGIFSSNHCPDYGRICDIETKYLRLYRLESSERFAEERKQMEEEIKKQAEERQRKIDAGETIDDESEYEGSSVTIGDVLAHIVCAPLYAIGGVLIGLSAGIDWLTDKIPVVGESKTVTERFADVCDTVF